MHAHIMNRAIALLAASLALLPVTSHAQQRPDEQNEARRDLRAGNVRSLRDIERRVLARAVLWHVQGRIMLNGSKTVVFPA